MSWFDSIRQIKHSSDILRLTFLTGAILSLSGCIEPLYGPKGDGGHIVSDLQAVKVEPIPDRLGHYLENELIFALNGTGSSPSPKYRLVVTVHERMSTPIVNTVTGEAEAGDVNVDAEYRLYPIAGSNEPVASGNVTNFVVYDRSTQRLSNVRAARDAEIRNAKVLADQIRTRIAVALANRHS
jgi:LPS-assembly lipoprotein